MASLSIRKVDPKLYECLRVRAARHGTSMEEEVRRILAKALSAPDSITEIFIQNFGNRNGLDLELLMHKPHPPMEFGA
jgi:antitoxin FitA